MTEQQLNAGAILIELGSLVAILSVWVRSPNSRSRLAVLLGAVAPLLFAYGYVAVRYAVLAGTDYDWAFHAMWLMSFWPYIGCVTIGIAVSLVKKPITLAARFLMGLAAPAGVWLLIQAGV